MESLPSSTKPSLTKRAKSFLAHLAAGRPTLEAYALAGYKGTPHAAYQLRCYLKQFLGQELVRQGWGRDELSVQVKALSDIPLDPEVKAVSVKQKIDILKLYDKMLPKAMEDKPKITPLKLSFNFSSEASKPVQDVQEGEVVPNPPVTSNTEGLSLDSQEG